MLNNLRTQLMPYWLQFQEQLQANQRLRWMMWGIVYIFVFYFSLVLNDWRQEHNQTVAQLQRTSVRLDQLKHQTEWPERWQQEKAVGEKLRSKLWETQSESLAEADLQNYLRKLMNDHNAQNYRPRLAPTERITIGGETLIKVAAEVTGSVAASQIDHFMKVLADNPKSLEMERFSYSPQRSGQLNMQVSAYFLIIQPQAADAQQRMIKMLLANLSSQERQLYGLIGISAAAALALGLLGGLISFSWGKNDRPDNWQASTLAASADTLADFTEISTQSRWFSEAGPATAEQSAEAARKAIEGQPESLKLIGIVERNNRPYALFIPVNPSPSNTGGPKGVLQFAAGEALVGDWVVKEITANTVVVVTNKEGTEQQTRELSLYQTKK